MRLLQISELKTVKGIPYTRPHLYKLMAQGLFPKPLKLGPNRIAFLDSEISQWIQERADERTAA